MVLISRGKGPTSSKTPWMMVSSSRWQWARYMTMKVATRSSGTLGGRQRSRKLGNSGSRVATTTLREAQDVDANYSIHFSFIHLFFIISKRCSFEWIVLSISIFIKFFLFFLLIFILFIDFFFIDWLIWIPVWGGLYGWLPSCKSDRVLHCINCIIVNQVWLREELNPFFHYSTEQLRAKEKKPPNKTNKTKASLLERGIRRRDVWQV